MGRIMAGPAVIIYYGVGLWGFILTLQYISSNFGWIAATISVMLFPIVFMLAPIYAGLVDGYWTPALVSYSPVILYIATIAIFGTGSLVLSGWRKAAPTVGAIAIAFVGSILLRIILGIVGGALGYGILTTTHVIWLPVAIVAAMNGAGTYIAFTLAFRWARTANRPATFWVVAMLFVAGVVIQWSDGTEHSAVLMMGAACTVASIIGGWIAVLKNRYVLPQDDGLGGPL